MNILKDIKVKASDMYTMRNALDTVIRALEQSNAPKLTITLTRNIKSAMADMVAARIEKDIAADYYPDSYERYRDHKEKADEIEQSIMNTIYCIREEDADLQMQLIGIEGKADE